MCAVPSIHTSIAPSSCCYPWSKLSERKEGREEGREREGERAMTAKLIMPAPSFKGAGLREMEDDGGGCSLGHVWEEPPEGERVLRQRESHNVISSANHNSMEEGWMDCGKEGGREGISKGTVANKSRKSRASNSASTNRCDRREGGRILR